jgi:DNA-binding NarL/FixJ family response regulator
MAPTILRALVVEDDRSWQQILSEILTDLDLVVDVASNLDEALAILKAQPHRLALVDLSLTGSDHNNADGLRVLDAVRRLDPGCRTILLTGFATVELAVSVLTEYGAFSFLRKENFHRGQFRDLVNRALASAPAISVDTEIYPGFYQVGGIGSPETDTPSRKILVVEDDAGWRSIISELLSDAGYTVRVCGSFGEAVGYLRRDKFSLAVVDLSLTGAWDNILNSQDLEGYQLLASTKASGVPTIVVSGVATPDYIQKAYTEQNIFAYIEKQTFDRNAFRQIVEDARVSGQVVNELDVLTDREREVLENLAQGMTNKEIAEKLVITTNTVKRHLKAVFEKLDVHTRSAAAAKARRWASSKF